MKFTLWLLTAVVLMVGMNGCSGNVVHMEEGAKDAVISAPKADESKIVFMRTGVYGVAKQTSVFEIVDENPKLVGILASGKKLVYTTTPGKHTFMAVGSGLDSTLMSTTLKKNKMYYVEVDIVGGIWSVADVVFVPMTDKADIKSMLDDCQLVKLNDESQKWADENAEDIKNNYLAAKETWLDTDLEDRVIIK
jgi:hypothetical protein